MTDLKTIITLNGESVEIKNGCNIEYLLDSLGISNKRLAVEINQQIIPRSEFSSYILNASDKVEIVQAIGGGSL